MKVDWHIGEVPQDLREEALGCQAWGWLICSSYFVFAFNLSKGKYDLLLLKICYGTWTTNSLSRSKFGLYLLPIYEYYIVFYYYQKREAGTTRNVTSMNRSGSKTLLTCLLFSLQKNETATEHICIGIKTFYAN